MLNILIVEDNFDIASILQRTLTYEFDCTTGTAHNARGAIEYLKKVKELDLIVTRSKIDNESTASSIINYVYENQLPTLVLVMGDVEVTGAKYETVPQPVRADELIAKAMSMFRKAGIKFKEASMPDYLPFSLSYFKIIEWVDCDVYIKMTKGGMDKFLKRIHKGDQLSGHNIAQYEANPLINELYITKEDRRIFYNNIFASAFKLIETDTGSKQETFANQAMVYETVQDAIVDFEIEKETVEITNKMTKKMQKTIMASDRIYSVIKDILSNPGSFSYKHSYLTSVFSYEILKRMDMFKEKDQIEYSFEKLVWVCFFHDIYLKEEKHQKISNKIDFFKANLDSVEKELVSTHANKAATLVQQFSLAPPGVDIIIKQHHGTSNGIGFTDFYKSNISPLAVVFIVAEEFVVKVLDFKERQQSISEILDELTIKFELPTYRKVLDSLKDLLSKK